MYSPFLKSIADSALSVDLACFIAYRPTNVSN